MGGLSTLLLGAMVGGYILVGRPQWVYLGGGPKCRLPASSQGLWQRAVFRSLPPACSKPIPFKVTRKQACSPTLCGMNIVYSGQWAFLSYQLYKEGEGGRVWKLMLGPGHFAGNGSRGKMPPSVPLSSQTCSDSITFLLIPRRNIGIQ